MKNILIMDFLFCKGHKTFNTLIIKCLAIDNKVDVISLNGYYDVNDFNGNSNIRLLSIEMNDQHYKGRINSRIFCMKVMGKSFNFMKEHPYDYIFCLSFETITLSLYYRLLKKNKVYFYYHNNLDELENPIKRLFFNVYKKYIKHIVLEKEFGGYLVTDLRIPENSVFYVPHPVLYNNLKNISLTYDCVGLSRSNSDELVKSIIESHEIQNSNLKIVLRANEFCGQFGQVKVINDYLDYGTYENYILSSKFNIVIVPDSFKYRLSGVIYDALIRRKIVLTTSYYYGCVFARNYPGICYYFKNIEEMINIIKLFNQSDIESSFNKFAEDHSLENVKLCLDRILLQ